MLYFTADSLPLPELLFINNEFVASKSAERYHFHYLRLRVCTISELGTKRTLIRRGASCRLTLIDPTSGSVVSQKVPIANEADVEAAIVAVEAAFPLWKKVLPRERQRMLLRLAELMRKNSQRLAELSRLTLGSPYRSFGEFEITLGADCFDYFAGWTDKFAGESFPQEDGILKIVRNEPLGVTAGICPWNSPCATIGMKAAAALATGNCFILKPSEKTPFAALALGELVRDAGFPPGVFQVLSGDGSTGALLASHMRVSKISFTGSVNTGKKIMEMAAKSNLKRVTLELGGKSPAIVFDDADIANAVQWCSSAIVANTGQVCFAASRVYVHEAVYEEFTQEYLRVMAEKAKVVGSPDDPIMEIGPLVDAAHFERVAEFIERGQSDTGKLVVGGKKLGKDGYFIEPTVFVDVDTGSEIHNEEIFGPVAIVNRFKDEDEVVRIANSTRYGLMAGVFTENITRALRVSSELDSGMVGINCVSMLCVQAPFGGTKESGIGRECGMAALRAFTETKTIMVNMSYGQHKR
ncbi:hypothetical protein PV08_05820 [Exophiala spinifera]|uniref:aldehyde dehydrogenase (NAD(+)) n=1 Tax=Exophiala spinifera TaxID=91928 RepID=A0A0D2BAY7_9EURO|nr:uncharacterized protein PV08_05820 [Exophiala spinifera]KIW15770.1 hypothetical protein PV08_05820 [Exophiala spinifera]